MNNIETGRCIEKRSKYRYVYINELSDAVLFGVIDWLKKHTGIDFKKDAEYNGINELISNEYILFLEDDCYLIIIDDNGYYKFEVYNYNDFNRLFDKERYAE